MDCPQLLAPIQRAANRFLYRETDVFDDQRRNLPPLPSDPDPATRPAFPVTLHPDCRRSRSLNPTARHPLVTRTGPSPITARPNITRTRRNSSCFNSHRRRRLRNENLTLYCPGRTSGYSFARSCRCRRRRDRRFSSAPRQSKECQQIKNHSHIILPL